MEQLIILTKDGTTYSTAQDDGSELTSNIRFNITLLDHSQITLKRKNVWQYWLKDYYSQSIVSIDNNGLVRMYNDEDLDAQDLFNKLFKKCKGKIEPQIITQTSHALK